MLNWCNSIWKLIEKWIYIVIQKIFVLQRKELTDEIFAGFIQFVKFGIVGLSNTMISYLLYILSLFWFQWIGVFPNTDYIISSMIGFCLSVLWCFYWNNKIVFSINDNQKRSIWRSLLKTYISYSFSGLFISNILLVFWVQWCKISPIVAPLINLTITIPLNFVMNKYWTFKK